MDEKTTLQQLDDEVDLLEKKVNNIISLELEYSLMGNSFSIIIVLKIPVAIEDIKLFNLHNLYSKNG